MKYFLLIIFSGAPPDWYLSFPNVYLKPITGDLIATKLCCEMFVLSKSKYSSTREQNTLKAVSIEDGGIRRSQRHWGCTQKAIVYCVPWREGQSYYPGSFDTQVLLYLFCSFPRVTLWLELHYLAE